MTFDELKIVDYMVFCSNLLKMMIKWAYNMWWIFVGGLEIWHIGLSLKFFLFVSPFLYIIDMKS